MIFYTSKHHREFSTISNWSPVSSIVFTSNTLPIVATQLSSPVVYQNGQQIYFKYSTKFCTNYKRYGNE